MPTYRFEFLICASLLLAGAIPARAQGLDPTQPPGTNFDLSHWYLQLPTSNGVLTAASGTVDSFSASQLTSGSTNTYFYTAPDGAMAFWVPDNGARTGGSDHPRSELRELLDPGTTSSNWTVYGTHVLTAQCKVLQVPSDTGKVCIGQAHEPNSKPDGSPSAGNEHMIMFDLNNKKIYVNINLDGNLSSSFSRTVISGSSVALNSTINYSISVVNGLLMIVINNITNSWDLFSGTNYQGHIAQNWAAASSNTLYFKAGNYNQTTNKCNCSTDGAKVAFYSLVRSHAPAISDQPDSLSVVLGSNATLTAAAAGNGPLRYQWRLNDTNELARATNASLTITNAQTTNAGNYTLKVTDSLGVLTSAVATLTALVPPAITTQPANQTITAGSNATFSVLATGTAPLRYQWYFNTNNPLARATNAALLLTNVVVSTAGVYSVVVSNSVGSLPSSFATLSVNRPPVAGVYSSVTGQHIPLSIPANNLLAVASDPDGDALTVSGVNPVSANGASVVLSNSVLCYSPLPAFVGLDQCYYTLTDARGASASGILTVTVVSSNAITLVPVTRKFLSDGSFFSSFQGVPGLRYVVDRATNIAGPWELGFTNLPAGVAGLFEFNDPNAPSQLTRFYRARYP